MMICEKCGKEIEEGDESCGCETESSENIKTVLSGKAFGTVQEKRNNGKVGFFKAVYLFFCNYFNFKNTASKSEYWWVILFYFLIFFPYGSLLMYVPDYVGSISMIVLVIPGISLTVRRFHDIGKSGIYFPLSLIPIYGPYLLARDSVGDNIWNYGYLPKLSDVFVNGSDSKDFDDITSPDGTPKKKLTKEVIDKDIKLKRFGLKDYLYVLIWSIAVLVFGLKFNPSVFACYFVLAISLFRMLRNDIKTMRVKYHVVQRVCINKKIVEDEEENTQSFELWFMSAVDGYYATIHVEKTFYEETEIGDEFYLVFILNDKSPCAHYRKSEWIISQ